MNVFSIPHCIAAEGAKSADVRGSYANDGGHDASGVRDRRAAAAPPPRPRSVSPRSFSRSPGRDMRKRDNIKGDDDGGLAPSGVSRSRSGSFRSRTPL